MPCCLADKYGWCKDIPDHQLEEHEGNKYCIFHLPLGIEKHSKGFVEALIDRFAKSLDKNEVCNLRGIYFIGAWDTSPIKVPPVDFSEAVVWGVPTFTHWEMTGDLNFTKATFLSHFMLGVGSCPVKLTFDQAVFKDNVYIFGNSFRDNISLENVVFEGSCQISNTHFYGDFSFKNSVVKKDAYFSQNVYHSSVDFTRSHFNEFANFEGSFFLKEALFVNTIFDNYALFKSITAKNVLHFNNAKFRDVFYLAEIDCVFLDFSYALFETRSFFQKIKYIEAIFEGCMVKNLLEFECVNLSEVFFYRAPIEELRFIDCIWPKHNERNIIRDAIKENGSGFFSVTNTADSTELKKEPPKDFYNKNNPLDDKKTKDLEQVSSDEPNTDEPFSPIILHDIFRRLKKVAVSEQDHDLASDWHFNEKEMALIQNKGCIKDFNGLSDCVRHLLMFIGLWLYKISSGYGERPLRAFFVLLLFASFPFCLWAFWGHPTSPLSYWPIISSDIPNETLSNASYTVYTIKIIYKILFAIQAGLFALSVRNRMRR